MAAKGRMPTHSDKLLGFLLYFGIITGYVFQTEQQQKFNCRVEQFWHYHLQRRADGIRCYYINTTEEANRAQQYIANQSKSITKVDFGYSDIDQFPKDFLLYNNIKEIAFMKCNMVEMPNHLFPSICSSMTHIDFHQCNARTKLIRPEGFKNCKNIEEIRITHCGIVMTSRTAFSGLMSLRLLELYDNGLETFGGFDSIPNLEELILNENKISYIGKNAFQGLKKLNEVNFNKNQLNTLEAGVFDPFINNKNVKIFLKENPFYCTCSLKWLQDWLQNAETNQFLDSLFTQPQCAGPVTGDLRTLNFCNITTTGNPALPHNIPTVQPLLLTTESTSPPISNQYCNLTSPQLPDSLVWPICLLGSTCLVAIAVILTVVIIWLKVGQLDISSERKVRNANLML